MDILRDEPKERYEGSSQVIVTIRVLPETRDYLNIQAKLQDISLNELIKQKLGIQTIRILEKSNGNKTEKTIENIYE